MDLPPATDIDGLLTPLQSGDAAVRRRGMQALLQRVRVDAATHSIARPCFDAAIASERDPATAVMAAQGIESVAGVAAARGAWSTLLARDSAAVVAHAALWVQDTALSEALIAVLGRHRDEAVRRSVMQALGRLRAPQAFDPLVAELDGPCRADAIQALQAFEDPRAIPFLQPFEHSAVSSGQIDERGGALSLGDITAAAIRRLEHVQLHPASVARCGPAIDGARPAGPASDGGGREWVRWTIIAALLAVVIGLGRWWPQR